MALKLEFYVKSKHIVTQIWGITEAKDCKRTRLCLKLALSISELICLQWDWWVLSPCVAILKVSSYFIKVQIIFTGPLRSMSTFSSASVLERHCFLITAHEQTQLHQVWHMNSYLVCFPCFQRFSFSELTVSVFLLNAFSGLSSFYFSILVCFGSGCIRLKYC